MLELHTLIILADPVVPYKKIHVTFEGSQSKNIQ